MLKTTITRCRTATLVFALATGCLTTGCLMETEEPADDPAAEVQVDDVEATAEMEEGDSELRAEAFDADQTDKGSFRDAREGSASAVDDDWRAGSDFVPPGVPEGR